MPKVSVLIPVYNVEKYLEECLDSIIDQTFKDIEIICVNDGSTDSSAKILEKYKKKDNRIVIVNKENGGLPSARNAGIDAAKGEYLSFVDSDDHIKPNMIERLYNTAKETNAEIVICGANIFPENPKAIKWLYDTLSPQKNYYEKCNSELLFDNPASRPFIWRTFVSKALIDRYNFRLKEDIHIGEDNAFQFRIYPKANGIAVIPDKLYNYRWFREDSLMNSVVYKNVEKKCLAHIKMVMHISEEWIKTGDIESFRKDFLKWSVEFLYDDFIKLPLEEKTKNAKILTEIWTKEGFYRFQYTYPDYIRDKFRYFYNMANEKAEKCSVSIIISIDSEHDRLEDTVKSCLEQTEKIELIIVNNASAGKTYSVINKYMMQDKRVRVYNSSVGHFTDGYNIGLEICKGKYVVFMRPDDRFADADVLKQWKMNAEKSGDDVALSAYKCFDSIIYPEKEQILTEQKVNNLFDLELGNALFLTEFIKTNKLMFENYSIESGKVFLAKACLSANKVGISDRIMYVSERNYGSEHISEKDCALVLKSFADRLELSHKYGSAKLHNKIYSLLSSSFYTDLIVNNTLPYFKPLKECPNGENSRHDVWEQLLKILSLIDPDMLSDGFNNTPMLPMLFCKFVDKRHHFIGDISDRYVIT